MSLERAYVNCMRCYHTHQWEKKQNYSGVWDSEKKWRSGEDSFGARDRTMKALEHAISISDELVTYGDFQNEEIVVKHAIGYLKSCATCDMNEPSVAVMIEDYLGLDEEQVNGE